LDRRIYAHVAVRAVSVLPALVPVYCGLDARITRAKHLESLFNPIGFAESAAFRRMWKFTGRPFRNHDRLLWIKSAHFLIRPIYQGRNVWIWFVLELLPINAEPEPIYVIGTGIVSSRAVPGLIRIGIIVCVKHPLNVRRTTRANAIDHMAVSRAECLRTFPIIVLFIPFGASVISS